MGGREGGGRGDMHVSTERHSSVIYGEQKVKPLVGVSMGVVTPAIFCCSRYERQPSLGTR